MYSIYNTSTTGGKKRKKRKTKKGERAWGDYLTSFSGILKSRSTEPNLRNSFLPGVDGGMEGWRSSHNEAIPLVMLSHIKDPGDLVDFGHLKFQ